MRRLPVLLLVVLAAAGCKRPIDGRNIGATVLSDLRVSPPYVRAGVEIDLSFKVTGAVPETVSFDIAGKQREVCTPLRESDGRLHCRHPGITRTDFNQGPTVAVLEARDSEGRASIVTAPVTIDFDCPRFRVLTVSPEIAQPNDVVVVTIEATEALAEPPIVTHGGRPWETALGQQQSFTVRHEVTIQDPQAVMPLVVRIQDLAGNTSGDCAADGMLSFAVDHTAPAVDIDHITLLRDIPGAPSRLTAVAGAFLDDIGIVEVRVLDETGTTVHARITPNADGSIVDTSLGVQPRTRVLVQAVDRFGRTSPAQPVPEIWTLSVGNGATPNAALRTDSRFSPAPPHSRSMKNRTAEGSPSVLRADARVLTERTRVAFHKVGDLPSSFEDAHLIITGYEPTRRTVVIVGGHSGTNFNLFAGYRDETLYVTWDEERGEYVFDPGPHLVKTRMNLAEETAAGVPSPRYGRNMAFDGKGCGVLFGGVSCYLADDGRQTITGRGDTWELCATESGYRWTRIPLPEELDNNLNWRVAPIIHDPLNQRYVIAGDNDDAPVLFLEPDADPAMWTVVPAQPLPSAFVDRSQALLFWDPTLAGFAFGLGYGPYGNGEHRHLWIYRNGQWTLTEVPFELGYRAYFGADYDTARQQVVLWGGNSTYPADPPDPTLWLLTGTASTSPGGWRGTMLDHAIARDWPSLVYDPDRQVTLVLGGVRLYDGRVVPPEIHQIITQPSSPHLQASIDLDAPRPKGIGSMHLVVRAAGTGDADGVGPGTATAGGVVVKLWDHSLERWDDVAITDAAPGVMTEVVLDIVTDPERYVSHDGTVPLTVTTRYPATEAVSARLDVDVISGSLSLQPGVTLP